MPGRKDRESHGNGQDRNFKHFLLPRRTRNSSVSKHTAYPTSRWEVSEEAPEVGLPAGQQFVPHMLVIPAQTGGLDWRSGTRAKDDRDTCSG